MPIETKDELLKELLYKGTAHGGETEVGLYGARDIDGMVSDELRGELLAMVEERDEG